MSTPVVHGRHRAGHLQFGSAPAPTWRFGLEVRLSVAEVWRSPETWAFWASAHRPRTLTPATVAGDSAETSH
jgi:hypothetical protein